MVAVSVVAILDPASCARCALWVRIESLDPELRILGFCEGFTSAPSLGEAYAAMRSSSPLPVIVGDGSTMIITRESFSCNSLVLKPLPPTNAAQDSLFSEGAR